MINTVDTHNEPVHPYTRKLERYYRIHSGLYDVTRWGFLFGRKKLLEDLPELSPYPNILEIGSGTGHNIQMLDLLYPDAQIYGVDLSSDMLDEAREKLIHSDNITLINGRYGADNLPIPTFDLVLLSYSLTMTGDYRQAVLSNILQDLNPGGRVAVVDFHTSPLRLFRRWMAMNHVRMEGNLLSELQDIFPVNRSRVHRAYFGLWSYFLFIGRVHLQ